MIIDAHHHFWRYTPEEYGWIPDRMAALRRDFLPADLKAEMDECAVEGAVTVQVRQTLEETRWLLELADQTPFVKAVVGWAPLQSPDLERELEPYAGHSKLRGVRHILQDEPANELMEDAAFNAGVSHLRRLGLSYDLLIYERHLPQAIRFVDRHPGVQMILNHVAKPRIAAGELEPWRSNLKELARRCNVTCKISGMITEANWSSWRKDNNLTQYFDIVLEAFGPKRLMFGSDWPVMLVAGSYRDWVRTVEGALSALSATEKDRIWSGTAESTYTS